jgi:hypothetical protein
VACLHKWLHGLPETPCRSRLSWDSTVYRRCGSQTGPVMVPAIAHAAQPVDVLRSLWEQTARAGSTRHPFNREVLTDLNTLLDNVAAAAPLTRERYPHPVGRCASLGAVLGDPSCSSPRPTAFGYRTSLTIGATLTPSTPLTSELWRRPHSSAKSVAVPACAAVPATASRTGLIDQSPGNPWPDGRLAGDRTRPAPHVRNRRAFQA